ncbi:MAG: hypothetical protein A4E65_01151 [Syntrophorhabdus sp. PtaU1.Bin153]|nr:MAG: hypothetical protein A4E65_01151 [Syntrophorhabdus sp. PtaU1.Bin153]
MSWLIPCSILDSSAMLPPLSMPCSLSRASLKDDSRLLTTARHSLRLSPDTSGMPRFTSSILTGMAAISLLIAVFRLEMTFLRSSKGVFDCLYGCKRSRIEERLGSHCTTSASVMPPPTSMRMLRACCHGRAAKAVGLVNSRNVASGPTSSATWVI